jgi:hypothetical protein
MTEQELHGIDSFLDVNGHDFVGLFKASSRKLFLLAAHLLPKYFPVDGCSVCRACLPMFEALPDEGWSVEAWRSALRANHAGNSQSARCESRDWFRYAFQYLDGNLTQVEWWNKLVDVACCLVHEEARRMASIDGGMALRSLRQRINELRREEYRAAVDILGNPFRPTPVVLPWLTWNDACVVTLAQSIYDHRQFEDMPILADALEEAGCDNADVLNHCRGHGAHVRGCWVVDLCLGKR